MNRTQLLNKTEDYIENHLHEKITLEEIAKHLNISKYHYHRLFSKYSLETPYQFISRIRMERSAIILISNMKVTITEVAHSYGFNDSSVYSNAFRRHFGISPSKFRKSKKRQA